MSTFAQLVEQACQGSPGAAAVLADAMTERTDTRFRVPENPKALLDAMVRAGAISDDGLLGLGIRVVEEAFAPWEACIRGGLRRSSRASRLPVLPPLIAARRAWQAGEAGEHRLRSAAARARETLEMSRARPRHVRRPFGLEHLTRHLGEPRSGARLARRAVGTALTERFWDEGPVTTLLGLVVEAIEAQG